MKIIKYISLLFFLLLVAFFVHIATQDGTFSISKNVFINAPQKFTYNYIDNLNNWEEWQTFKRLENNINFNYNSAVKGNKAGFSWNINDNIGSLQTLESYNKDSILQTITFNNNTYSLFWNFNTVDYGTQITFKLDGKKDFLKRLKDFFDNKSQSIFEENLSQSLENLKNNLNKEFATYSVDTLGTIARSEIYYTFEKAKSNSDNIAEDIVNIVDDLNKFIKKNSLHKTGKPFVILEEFSDENDINYSICIPIKEEIFTTEDSKIKGTNYEGIYAYKSVLKGDYSHFKTALEDTKKAILNTEEKEDFSKKVILVLETSFLENNKPSEWITNIFVPLEKKDNKYHSKI